MLVHLWLADEPVPTFDVYEQTVTDAQGKYAFDQLPPGDYTVEFHAAHADEPVRSAWLAGNSEPAGPGAPGVFHVGATATDFNGNKALLPLTKLASTTSAKLAKTRIDEGRSTKVTVTVKVPGVTGPTGTVKVYDGRKVLKTVTLAAAKRGVVVVKLVKPKKGKHKISARYAGSDIAGSSASRTVTLKVT